ncbi:MAG: disulfide bond formation protein B [Alphaproteobacteria bacterium]|nr:MAG: disulfide bond formation protein B [Alphaproteobacteria bacterium]
MAASLLAGAYAFEYIGGLIPCDLCWPQRYAHMAILGLSAAGLLLGKASNLLHSLLAWATVLALSVSIAVSGYHAGVEQKWWKGPDTCTTGDQDVAVDMASLFDGMMESSLVMCDDIAWEMFGISMAGYNFLISTAVGLFVTAALVARFRKKS